MEQLAQRGGVWMLNGRLAEGRKGLKRRNLFPSASSGLLGK